MEDAWESVRDGSADNRGRLLGWPGLCGSAADDEEMWAGSDQFGRSLDGSDETQKRSSALGVSEPVVQIEGDQCGPFDRQGHDWHQPRVGELGGKLAGTVEVGGREPLWTPARVAVLSVGKVTPDDATEVVIGEEPSREAVAQGCVSADRHGDHQSVGAEYLSGVLPTALPAVRCAGLGGTGVRA